jgi:hypothetical protein
MTSASEWRQLRGRAGSSELSRDSLGAHYAECVVGRGSGKAIWNNFAECGCHGSGGDTQDRSWRYVACVLGDDGPFEAAPGWCTSGTGEAGIDRGPPERCVAGGRRRASDGRNAVVDTQTAGIERSEPVAEGTGDGFGTDISCKSCIIRRSMRDTQAASLGFSFEAKLMPAGLAECACAWLESLQSW